MEHKTFYFKDGNIILRVKQDAARLVENTAEEPESSQESRDSHILFRVHQSVLTLHSSIMISIPEPPMDSADRELVDGCDVIDLHDPLQDIEKLISALYGMAPIYKRLMQQSFDYFAPIIRLSDKYGISQLFKKYTWHVVDGWPKSLREWNEFNEEVKEITQQEKIPQDESLGSEFISVVHPACIIRLAEDYSLSSILPAAYYHLSRLPQGINRPFSDQAQNIGGLSSTIPSLRTAEIEKLYLGNREMKRFLLELAVAPNKIVADWPISTSTKHKAHGHTSGVALTCQPSEWWSYFTKQYVLELLYNQQDDVLGILQLLVQQRFSCFTRFPSNIAICTNCHQGIERGLAKARERAWTQLPDYFCISM
ncbi:hypothetical protein FRC02_003498 [Tulasnella sp. 418]|nr:hypothetical protein FRC02_003498 [Tulasnella sp. 418]